MRQGDGVGKTGVLRLTSSWEAAQHRGFSFLFLRGVLSPHLRRGAAGSVHTLTLLCLPAGRHPAAPDRGGPPSSPRLLRALQPRLRHCHPRLAPVPGPQPGRIREWRGTSGGETPGGDGDGVGDGDALGAAASGSTPWLWTHSAPSSRLPFLQLQHKAAAQAELCF